MNVSRARHGHGRRWERRNLDLRIRVSPARGYEWTKAQLVEKVLEAADTGVIPVGVVITFIDWKKAKGQKAGSGSWQAEVPSQDFQEALQRFAGALKDGKLRAERVE